MIGHWAFNWVQRLAHNKKPFFAVWFLLTLLAGAGLFRLSQGLELYSWVLLGGALLLIGVVLARLMDSSRVALLHLLLSFYIVGMTLGLLGWVGETLNEQTLLGLIVLMTVMTSNLVHIASTLLREMARGLFQFDAVAEALKLNSGPVFLANITTLMGFVMAAWYEPSLTPVAWTVAIGVAVSYLTTVTLLPAILLSWRLEFRVGHSADRYGYLFVVDALQRFPRVIKSLMLLVIVSVLWLAGSDPLFRLLIRDMAWMLVIMLGLFVLFWRSIKLAVTNTLVNLLALVASLLLFSLIYPQSQLSLLWLMMPLGLIVDDGIHFFSRYVRARQNLFVGEDSGVRYAMASVARPIWISSWVMLAGLAVLLWSPEESVQKASQVTILSVWVATFLILMVVPAFLVKGNKT